MKYYRVYNEKLTERARQIFGYNLVMSAYLAIDEFHLDDFEREYENNLYRIDLRDETIYYNACAIIIQFNNGHLVLFWNSEWAHMERMNIEDAPKKEMSNGKKEKSK